ncbi:MAG: chloride channel protein, partial [Proteobacteria bacterium]|nr:chloride channel protein [Pseudomonadota bacterium]
MSGRVFKELLLILVIGSFIGLLMAVIANQFVLGVQFAKEVRESSQWLEFNLPWGRYSLAPVVFLTGAA